LFLASCKRNNTFAPYPGGAGASACGGARRSAFDGGGRGDEIVERLAKVE